MLAVFAVSWASILIRLSAAPPLVISFYRLAIAALCLLPFARFARSGRWLREKGTSATAIAAGVLLGLHFASWITSLQLTSVASSVVLVTTTPVFTALFSAVFLGEKAGRAAWTGIALSVAGSILIAYGDYRAGTGAGISSAPGLFPHQGKALLGDALAFAGALFVAGYFVLGRGVRERAPLTAYLVVVYGTGAATVGLWAVGKGDPFTGYSWREYLLLASIAVVPNLIGHSLLNWAVRRMRTYVVNVAVLGEPVLATVYAALLFGEIPGLFWVAGTLMIVGGVLTVFFAERPAEVEDASSA